MLWYSLRVATALSWNHWFAAKAQPDQPFRVGKRAWPWLCDVYFHLNNAAYMRLAEDARWAWTARTPLFARALRERWSFLVGGADLLYRRPVPLMSRFEVVSRLIGVDERWLYFSQEFVLPDQSTACRIILRAMVRSKQGAIEPRLVAEVVGTSIPDPSEEVGLMKQLADAQLSAMKQPAR